MSTFESRLRVSLSGRRENKLYRNRLTLESSQGPVVQLAGREFLNFCSNDYLGLAAHPEVVDSFIAAARQYGVGSGASHLVCGHSAPHQQLEEALADFTGRDRALLFSSGYAANTGVLASLLHKGDNVLEDRLNHASLLDGGLHSGARFQRFRHNDVDDLRRRMAALDGPAMVVVDGVYSMDGDSAPVAELSSLCAETDSWLMVDDAHGFGVAGHTGAGTLQQHGLGQDDVPILMATLGKALGVVGAFVAGSELLIESLIQQTRTYIYTTALPPAVAAAAATSLQLLQREAWRRQQLATLIEHFRVGAAERQLPLMPSQSAIQPLLVGEAEVATRISTELRQKGVLVTAIRPPTVAAGTSRLRVTLTAGHTAAQVELLLDALSECFTND
jgi:8-amino-7-oxononanoate synthase